MVDLDARPQAVGEGVEAARDDHELLDVDRVVGVGAAVQDVEHGYRQQRGGRAAEIGVERQAGEVGRRLGHRQRHAENGVGAEPALAGGAVELDESAVDEHLVPRVHALDGAGDLVMDVVDRLGNALAEETVAAVAQLQGLARAGGRAGRHHGATQRAAFQQAVHFDGRISARVEDLSRDKLFDIEHGSLVFPGRKQFG